MCYTPHPWRKLQADTIAKIVMNDNSRLPCLYAKRALRGPAQSRRVAWLAGVAVTVALTLSSCSTVSTGTFLGRSWAPHSGESRSDASTKVPRGQQATIILDAGHGGADFGAVNAPMGLVEKRLTLKTARLTRAALKKLGYTVVMTRDSDTQVSLKGRVELANKYKNALFVSIHFNSAHSKSAEGVEVFYFEDPSNSNRSYLSKSLSCSIIEKSVAATRCNNRGVKIGAFRVIKATKMPAVLVEGGFITHPVEGRQLAKSRYLHNLSRGIAQGVASYEKRMRSRKYLR